MLLYHSLETVFNKHVGAYMLQREQDLCDNSGQNCLLVVIRKYNSQIKLEGFFYPFGRLEISDHLLVLKYRNSQQTKAAIILIPIIRTKIMFESRYNLFLSSGHPEYNA